MDDRDVKIYTQHNYWFLLLMKMFVPKKNSRKEGESSAVAVQQRWWRWHKCEKWMMVLSLCYRIYITSS